MSIIKVGDKVICRPSTGSVSWDRLCMWAGGHILTVTAIRETIRKGKGICRYIKVGNNLSMFSERRYELVESAKAKRKEWRIIRKIKKLALQLFCWLSYKGIRLIGCLV